jgi:hypothetical protein
MYLLIDDRVVVTGSYSETINKTLFVLFDCLMILALKKKLFKEVTKQYIVAKANTVAKNVEAILTTFLLIK